MYTIVVDLPSIDGLQFLLNGKKIPIALRYRKPVRMRPITEEDPLRKSPYT